MRELARRKRALIVALATLAAALAVGVAVPVAAETPATALPANPPTCTAKALGVSRASNPGLAADCDTLLAIQSTLRVSGWINYDTPSWWDHSYALNWSAHTPLRHWRAVTLGGTPQRVIGLDFSDTRESIRVFDARTRQWEASQPFTREWTLRGVIPTQLGNLTALETLDLGGSELTGAVPTQLGKLTKLTRLDLGDNKLTGELPETLDALTALTQVRVAGNAFTRCAPHGLWEAASHDLATLGLPNCRPTVSYGAPQTTGVVDARGEYAFFTDAGATITTYEGLRSDVARLTIHERDTSGTSWAWFYDDVEEGDTFEWRKANDCWVRYVVDEVLADPSATVKSLSVEHYAYAYAGCSGTVSLTGNRTLTWVPAILSHPDFTTAIRFGPFILYQPGWKGEYEDSERTALRHGEPGEQRAGRIFSTDLATVRRHPLWREPDLPDGWTLTSAEAGTDGQYGYWAHYAPPGGGFGVNIVIGHRDYLPFSRYGSSTISARVQELRIIDGHPALVEHSPVGTAVPSPPYISIYHEATGIFYEAFGWAPSLRRAGGDAMLAIARSLYLNEGDE